MVMGQDGTPVSEDQQQFTRPDIWVWAPSVRNIIFQKIPRTRFYLGHKGKAILITVRGGP
jgi:hypothetical protein